MGDNLIHKIEAYDFSYVAAIDPSTITLYEDVRKMCSTNTCGMYQHNWSCPPACGELDLCRAQIKEYCRGFLVQSVGDIEDSWDFEGMTRIEEKHKKRFAEMIEELTMEGETILPLGTGACTICQKCSYPDEPCRFPKKRISSLEAYGILVSELCKINGVGYYYGSNKMAYTSCVLLK